jgi:hypothetical protein
MLARTLSPLIAAVFPPWREDGARNRSTDVKRAVRPLHRRRIKLPRQHQQAFEQIVVGDDEFAPVRRVVRCVGALVEAASVRTGSVGQILYRGGRLCGGQLSVSL